MKNVSALVLVLVTAMSHATSAAAQSRRPAILNAVTVSASQTGEVTVTISAIGPLPRPKVGVLQDPPRIYLDFPNVGVGRLAREMTSRDAPVLRIRTGVHPTPPTTRVVIDLAAPQPHRLEMNPSAAIVIIGQPAPVVAARLPGGSNPDPVTTPVPAPTAGVARRWADIPPVPALSTAAPERVTAADPVKPPGSAPPSPAFAPIGPPPPAGDLERYRKQAWAALDRLRLQQPLLMSLDAGESMTADRAQMAIAEFERLRQDLVSFKAPETLATYHAMLVQSSTLGLMAFTLRLDAFRTSDASTTRNASSAAAGAILLIERACAVITCPPVPGR